VSKQVDNLSMVDGNDFIRHHLKNNKIFAAGKIGANEIKMLYYNHYNIHPPGTHPETNFFENFMVAGIFPIDPETCKSFSNIFTESIKCLDLAPKWNGLVKDFEIDLYNRVNPKCYNTPLRHLEPYYFDNPWTEFLENKTVLVISPFADSIEKQYPNLSKIWNGKIKNNFKLKTIRFPFSAGLSDEIKKYVDYKTCLEHFKSEINKVEFDFAMLGCGAYALPLCHYIKSTKGKSCIHLGGATQIMFGVYGNRWLSHPTISKFFNEYWVRPSGEEVPQRVREVENGCYW